LSIRITCTLVPFGIYLGLVEGLYCSIWKDMREKFTVYGRQFTVSLPHQLPRLTSPDLFS
jgi:hypothetical protein